MVSIESLLAIDAGCARPFAMALEFTGYVANYACFAYATAMAAWTDSFRVREATSFYRLAESLMIDENTVAYFPLLSAQILHS